MHLLSHVAKCTVADSPLKTPANCSKCPLSAWLHFWLMWPENVWTYETLQRCWCFLLRWEFAGIVLLSCSPCMHTPLLSCNPTHGNLMGSDLVTVVANSMYLHDQSIDLRICDSDTALQPDWNEVTLLQVDNIFVVVFVEEYSSRVPAVYLAKRWRKCHLSDDMEKCTDLSVGHQWHHKTRLWKKDVGRCFQ